MATPTPVAWYSGAANSGLVTVSVPSVQVGDWIVAGLYEAYGAATLAPGGSGAGTWTQIGSQVGSPDSPNFQNVTQAMWRKAATATGTYTVTLTTTNENVVLVAHVRGVDAVDGTPSIAAVAQGSSTRSVAMAATSPTTADALLLGFASLVQFSGTTTWTAPSGMTERADTTPPVATITAELSSQVLAASGSTGTKTAAASGSGTVFGQAYCLVALSGQSTVSKSGGDTGTGSESGTVTATVTGSDSGTGSETGTAAELHTGSDSGTGSEAGFVALSQSGGDSGSGSEVGSVDATTTGSDSGTGSETGTINADTSGGDSGTGSSGGFIKIPGSDSGTGSSALASLVGNTTGGDSGTGSDGGYVETLYGDLVISLWAIHPTTGATVALPDGALTISPERNSAGSISLSYPETGQNFDLLRDTVTDDRDLEVEIWTIGSPLGALRGYLQEAAGDDVSEDVTTWRFAGSFLPIRLSEAVVYPQAGTEKQELVFSAVTPGALVATIMSQAQARGTLTDITLGFSNTVDSNGTPWPSVITTKFSPGAGYDQILGKLVDLGLAEWDVVWTGTAKQLRLWVPEGRGVDRTLGTRPVVLRAGRNILESPRKWSVRDAGTAILAAGSEGVYETATDASAQSRRGRRIELSASAANIDDSDAVLSFAQAQLAILASGTLEVTHGIGFLPGEPRPVIAFDVGDWVYSQTSNAPMERLRVVQWTLTVDPEQNPSGTVTLNDQMTDQLMRQQRRLNALTSGETVVGTSESSTDTGVPLPPTSLTASSAAFLVGGDARASVLVGWTPPTANVDGSTITDLAGFTVQYGFGLSPTIWNAAASVNSGTTTSARFTTDPGQTIAIRVAAFDRAGNISAWSSPVTHTTAVDVTAPPTTSTPSVANYLGVLRITWDGKTSTGADMLTAAADFHHLDVHISTSSGFTPSSATSFDRLFAAGTVVYTDGAYGTTYYAKFVAVDGSGNASAGSAQGSDAPVQVVSLDVFDGAIGSAKLADLAVTTAKINNLAVNDAKFGSGSFGKLTAGTISVDVTNAGIIRSGTTGQRYELDAAALRLYNTAGTQTVGLGGTVNFVTGEFRTALTGQRIVFNPGGAVPDTINVYPSGASDFARIMARTAPADGTAAILIDGGAATGVGRGRLGAYKAEAFVSWVTNDAGGDSSAGFSRTALSCNANDVLLWTQDSIQFDKYSGSTPISQSHLYVTWVTGGAGSNTPLLTANHASTNAGIKFDSGTIVATINEGSLFGPMNASAFNVVSTRAVKSNIADIRSVLDPLQLFRTVQAKTYKYTAEVDHFGDAAPQRFGPIAEDLPDELVHLTPYASTGELVKAVSLGDQVGALWAVANQILAQRLVHTTATVTPPALATANTDIDVTAVWDDGPTQTVPAQISIVAVGPGPLQQRAITATVVATTTTGVTVRFRSKRALTGGAALDPEDRWVVHAVYEFTPPYEGAP